MAYLKTICKINKNFGEDTAIKDHQKVDLRNGILPRLYSLFKTNTQADIAKLMGVTAQTFNGWLARNSVPWSYLYNLAKENKISFEWILDGSEPLGYENKTENPKAGGGHIANIFTDEVINDTFGIAIDDITIHQFTGDSMSPTIEGMIAFLSRLQSCTFMPLCFKAKVIKTELVVFFTMPHYCNHRNTLCHINNK